MDQNLEKFEVIRNIEKLYEGELTRKGMGSFMKLAWNNIKEKFNSEPHILELCIRLMIEELFVYAIASKLSIYENFLIKSGIRKEDKNNR